MILLILFIFLLTYWCEIIQGILKSVSDFIIDKNIVATTFKIEKELFRNRVIAVESFRNSKLFQNFTLESNFFTCVMMKYHLKKE